MRLLVLTNSSRFGLRHVRSFCAARPRRFVTNSSIVAVCPNTKRDMKRKIRLETSPSSVIVTSDPPGAGAIRYVQVPPNGSAGSGDPRDEQRRALHPLEVQRDLHAARRPRSTRADRRDPACRCSDFTSGRHDVILVHVGQQRVHRVGRQRDGRGVRVAVCAFGRLSPTMTTRAATIAIAAPIQTIQRICASSRYSSARLSKGDQEFRRTSVSSISWPLNSWSQADHLPFYEASSFGTAACISSCAARARSPTLRSPACARHRSVARRALRRAPGRAPNSPRARARPRSSGARARGGGPWRPSAGRRSPCARGDRSTSDIVAAVTPMCAARSMTVVGSISSRWSRMLAWWRLRSRWLWGSRTWRV